MGLSRQTGQKINVDQRIYNSLDHSWWQKERSVAPYSRSTINCSWVWLRHDKRQEKPPRKHKWFLHIFFITHIFSNSSAFQAVITIHALKYLFSVENIISQEEVQMVGNGLTLVSVLLLGGWLGFNTEIKTELQLFQDGDGAGAMAVSSLNSSPQKETLSVAPASMEGQRLHCGLHCIWRWGDGKGNN